MASSTVSASADLTRHQGGGVALQGIRTVQPASLASLIAEVLTARNAGETITVAGAGFPPAAGASGLVIDLSQLTGIVSTDAESNTVTFCGGTTVGEANELLHERGLDMVGAPVDAQLTLAGAASMGAHGLNPAEPVFSGAITGITFVTGNGEVRTVDARRNAELWGAAKLSLGALGVPAMVTVAVRPYRGLDLRHRRRPINELVNEFAEARAKTDFYCVDWRPQANDAHLTVGWFGDSAPAKPVSSAPTRRALAAATAERKPSRIRRVRESLARRIPFLAPVIARVANRVERVGDRTAAPTVLDGVTTEFYVAPARMSSVVAGLRDLARGNRELASALVRISLVAPDDAWASAAYRSEVVAVAVTVPQADSDVLEAVENLLLSLGGLPNWGEFNTVTGAEAAYVMPRFGDFLHVRHDTDPYGKLQSQVISRLLP